MSRKPPFLLFLLCRRDALIEFSLPSPPPPPLRPFVNAEAEVTNIVVVVAVVVVVVAIGAVVVAVVAVVTD